MYNQIEEGVKLFNEQDFFAAHDFFENLWMTAESKERLFFQGMVQISVGGYHLLNQNYKGSLSQFKKGTDKLKEYIPHYKGIELEILLQKINYLITNLELYFSEGNIKIEIEKIPQIEKI
jgi:predicted metal-dependent hydrolase